MTQTAEQPLNEIAKTQTQVGKRGIELATLGDLWRFSQYVASSGLAPTGFELPQQCMVAIQFGLELGLTPMQSLQNLMLVNGRPTLWGDAVMAIVENSGLLEDFYEEFEGEGDTLTAVCVTKRRGRSRERRDTFSVADAKAAGLWGKTGPWKQYPKRMLQMRARGFNFRNNFADVLKGMYIAEEAMDIPVATASVVKDDDATDAEVKPANRSEGLANRLMQREPEGEPDFIDADTPAPKSRADTQLSAPEASLLHKDLARLGIPSPDHIDFATGVLQRDIESLTDLTHTEAERVRNRANGVPDETEVA